MSESIARGRGTDRRTCQKCNRTVYLVVIDGVRVEVDPELISVVPFETLQGTKIFDAPVAKTLARRVHAEMCLRYQSEAARLKALHEAKRAQRDAEKAARKKPKPGKREPGQ